MSDPDAIARFLDRLSRMPEHIGVVWRGVPAPLEAPVTLSRPVPASLEPRYASENFTSPVLLAIASRTARSVGMLSKNPDEGELVFMPGTTLGPIAPPTVVDGVVVQFVEEFGATPDQAPPRGLPKELEVLEREIAGALTSSRLSREVAIGSPGKYIRALPV